MLVDDVMNLIVISQFIPEPEAGRTAGMFALVNGIAVDLRNVLEQVAFAGVSD